MVKLGSQVKLGEVFMVNGDQFKIIKIEPSMTNPDSRRIRFVSLSTGREYVRLLWNNDTLLVA
jgi:hypothetical protein